jgi:hypothetical protein
MRTKDGVIIDFTIPIKIGIGVIIFVIISSLTYLFYNFPLKRDSIEFFSILIGSIGVAGYAAYYSIIHAQNKHNYSKIQHTIEFIGFINSIELTRLRFRLQSYMQDNKDEQIKDASQYVYISKNEDIALALKSSLNLFESLSIAIQFCYIDEVVANKNLDFIIIYFYDTYLPFIETVREKNNDSFIYDEVEKLAISWKNKKYLSSGEEIVYTKVR